MKPTLSFFFLCLIVAVCITNGLAQQPPQRSPALPPSLESKAAAQTPEVSKEEAQLLVDLISAELDAKLYALTPDAYKDNKDKISAAERIAAIYARIADNPRLTSFLLGKTLREYMQIREGARSAMQVSQAVDEASMQFQLLLSAQNQTLIEQNKRIIALLEQIAKKK